MKISYSHVKLNLNVVRALIKKMLKKLTIEGIIDIAWNMNVRSQRTRKGVDCMNCRTWTQIRRLQIYMNSDLRARLFLTTIHDRTSSPARHELIKLLDNFMLRWTAHAVHTYHFAPLNYERCTYTFNIFMCTYTKEKKKKLISNENRGNKEENFAELWYKLIKT